MPHWRQSPMPSPPAKGRDLSIRVGIARCDAEGLLATPVATVDRATAAAELRDLVRTEVAVEVYVGLPLGLDGRRGRAAELAMGFATELATGLAPVPVRLVDERLTTISATRDLQSAGRRARSSRHVVDQAAAVVILEHALALERSLGIAPGTLVEEVS
jgi:putative Holliday junction resolvase